MPEILTESFCERCGTRYTFESAAPKRGRLGRVRVLTHGLKNYVLSDETTLSEAMADARSEQERNLTAHQLEAFHQTFNFCMSCRQYTCANCWNTAEGRCLTCAPHLGHEILPAPFPSLDPTAALEVESGQAIDGNGHLVAEEWPEIDLPPGRLDRAVEGIDVAPEPEAEAAPPSEAEAAPPSEAVPAWPDVEIAPEPAEPAAAEVEVVSEPVEPIAEPVEPVEPVEVEVAEEAAAVAETADVEVVAAEPESDQPSVLDLPATPGPLPRIQPRSAAHPIPIPGPAGDTVEERAAAAAAQTNAILAKFRPGQSLDAAIAAYEEGLARARGLSIEDLESAVEAEPVAAAPEPQPEAEPQPEPQPVAAEAAPEPPEPRPEAEPVAAEAAPESQPEAEPVAAEAEPEPVAAEAAPEPQPEPEPAAPAPRRDDIVEQPAWRITAPDATVPGTTPPTPVAPAQPWTADGVPGPAPAAPEWPTTPQWPTASGPARDRTPAVPTLAGRPLVDRSAEALWIASSQEVLAQPGPANAPQAAIRPCQNCGLSLSAHARFCRRCGTPQS